MDIIYLNISKYPGSCIVLLNTFLIFMYQIIILFLVCKSVTLSLFFNSMNLNQCWNYVDVMISTLTYLRKISGFVFTIQQKKSREMLESHSLGIVHYKTQNIFNCTIFHILPKNLTETIFDTEFWQKMMHFKCFSSMWLRILLYCTFFK